MEVRVIGEKGENLGILKTVEAVALAKEKDLDLILISENANPPVAKILDFNKYLYEERKKFSSAKAKSKKSELKEFRFGPTIGESDLTTRVQRAKEFIKDGNRVKVSIKLKGREAAYPQIGYEKVKKFTSELSEVAKSEGEPRLIGNIISIVYVGR